MTARGPVLALLTVLFVCGQVRGETNVTASAGEVETFLGGKTGKLVYVDANDGGRCWWIDLSDMSVHLLSEDPGCREPLISPDGTRVVYGLVDIVSKWPGQSQDNQGDAYVRSLSGGERHHVAGPDVGGTEAFSPHWWVDPANGDEYVVFMDYYEKDTQSTAGRATWKQKLAADEPSGAPIKILDHAFDGGLTPDGTLVGEAYHYLHVAATIDLGGGDGTTISPRLDGGNQACNASMSPDENHHIMHLRIDHEGCNILDTSDNLVQTIWKPSGAAEMQTPEFSNHPGYSTFTAEFSGSYHMYIADTGSGAHLKVAEGDFSTPHLWVASDVTRMALSPASLTFQATEGGAEPASQDVAVTNTGAGTLDPCSATPDAAWLAVETTGAGNDQVLVNRVAVSGLAAGSHSASVEVACPNAANSPLSYGVALEVEPSGADVEPPVVSITTPAEEATVSGAVLVEGTASDDTAVALVEVRVDNGVWNPADGTSDWQFMLDTSMISDGAHLFTARATDTAGNSATDAVGVSVDNGGSGMSITILEPQAGDVWEVGGTEHIRWQTEGVQDVTLKVSTDGGGSWETIAVSVDASMPEWGDYPWTVPDTPSEDCKIFISEYFGEVPTESGTFAIRPPGQEDDDEIVIEGSCGCAAGRGGSLLLVVLVLIGMGGLRRRAG